MMADEEFLQDTEFQKLLARRTDVDLTTAALEIARDAYPLLDFAPVMQWIDNCAGDLSSPLAFARTDLDTARAIGKCLAGQHGLTGSTESYESADGSFLHRVIELRRGIPISLSVLYIAVATRAGCPLSGVSAPGHFLTRYETMDGPLFIDAFAHGNVETLHECLARVQTGIGLTGDAALSALEPVGPRSIIIRMLNNLKALYITQNQWPAAYVVQRRLAALQPGSYSERRDLAMVTLKADRPGPAVNLLEACLETCPEDEKQLLETQLAEARRQLIRWN